MDGTADRTGTALAARDVDEAEGWWRIQAVPYDIGNADEVGEDVIRSRLLALNQERAAR